jgi:hypothetical protein
MVLLVASCGILRFANLVVAVELLGQVVYFFIAHRGTFVSNFVSPTKIGARSPFLDISYDYN